MIEAAGILFIARSCVLLLQRAEGGDAPGKWGIPGGKLKFGESAIEAARRECVEEIGLYPPGEPKLFHWAAADGVDYTTFVQNCAPFEPTLNDEHTAFAWVPLTELSSSAITAAFA